MHTTATVASSQCKVESWEFLLILFNKLDGQTSLLDLIVMVIN